MRTCLGAPDCDRMSDTERPTRNNYMPTVQGAHQCIT
jgi:hypothetical protein